MPLNNAFQHPEGTRPMLGHYMLLREIARSNDVVWEATDPQMGRRVAVKELALPPTLAGPAKRERIDRFYREARAAGAMSHPNIVTIYEVGEDNGRYFIAMEYLEGHTLRERLAVGGAVPLAEAVSIASALCDALEYAHGRGVIHRDIKPDNVHLLPGGRVKLTDFGIARITYEDSLTIDGQVFGTPSYMSPEQVIGKAIDTRSDIFSLGVLLYETLSGKKPFTGDSVVTITYRILHDGMPPLAGLPPSLEAMLARALAKEPADRFATAAELRAALVAAAHHHGIFASPLASSPLSSPEHRGPAPGIGVGEATVGYSDQTLGGKTPDHGNPAFLSNTLMRPVSPDVSAQRSRSAARNFATILLSVLLLSALVLGAAWMLSKAYRNYTREAGVKADAAAYQRAKEKYDTGAYDEAAKSFQWLCANGTSSESRQNARLGLLYCYRQLGGRFVRQNDMAAAERYFRAAVALAPQDPQARQELHAVLKARGAPPEADAPELAAPPKEASQGSPPSGPLHAPATSADFQNANAAKAAEAARLLEAGSAASRRGDGNAAARLWGQAEQAGPGSPAALQARQYLNAYNAGTSPW